MNASWIAVQVKSGQEGTGEAWSWVPHDAIWQQRKSEICNAVTSFQIAMDRAILC